MNKTLIFAVLSYVFVSSCTTHTKRQEQVLATKKPFDELIDKLKSNRIDTLAKGFSWSEGPLWLEETQTVIFSDVPENIIYMWNKESGLSTYLTPSGYTSGKGKFEGANGLLLNPEGKLVICQHGDRRMAYMNAPLNDPKPDFETITSSYSGKKLNSPNDAVYNKNGDLFFTDPPYGLLNDRIEELREIAHNGVYKHSKDGETVLLIDSLTRPNGIALSPDETKLYVANSDEEKAYWVVYDLSSTYTLSNGRIFYDATDRVTLSNGLPDGLKITPEGIVFATGPGGVFVFSPDGELLHTIETGQATANCAFNTDYSTLYMTADCYLFSISLL